MLATATTSGGVVDRSVVSGLSGLVSGSNVYIGVDSANSGQDGTAVNYQLWFLRASSAEAGSAGLSLDGGASEAAITAAGPLNFAGPGRDVSVSAGSTGSASAMSASALTSAHSSALAAAPSAGFLSDTAPTVTLAMAAPAPGRSDLLADRPSGAVAFAHAFENRSGDGDDSEGPRPLVAIQGPGGLPVLAATATGDWQEGERETTSRANGHGLIEGAVTTTTEPCAAALGPLMVAIAAPGLRAQQPAGPPSVSAGTCYAALAAAYGISIDPAQFLDLLPHRRAFFRPRVPTRAARKPRNGPFPLL